MTTFNVGSRGGDDSLDTAPKTPVPRRAAKPSATISPKNQPWVGGEVCGGAWRLHTRAGDL